MNTSLGKKSSESWFPDLKGADLHGMNLAGIAFFETDLAGTDLSEADLSDGVTVSGNATFCPSG